MLGTPPAFILSQDQTLMLKCNVSSETFKILIWKKFSRSKWTWLSIFILLLNWVVLELLDCSNDSRQFMFSEFPHSPLLWHGPLRCKTVASFRKLLNIRNIFRVAFLSCSHIRLEMCSGPLQGRCRSVVFALFSSAATTSKRYHSVLALSTTFLRYFPKSFFSASPRWFQGTKKWNEPHL